MPRLVAVGIAALAAGVLTVGVGRVLTQPTAEERAEARAGACLLANFAMFGGPSLAHEMFRGTEDGDLPDWVEADMVDTDGLPRLEDAGRDVARAAEAVLEYGATLGRGEAPTEDASVAYVGALAVLASACDEESGGEPDRADQPLDDSDDPAIRDFVERLEPDPADGTEAGR